MSMDVAHSLPFGRQSRNWMLAAAGLASIGLGYVLLSVPPADGFLSLTLAPILLVLGYCVLVPAAMMVRPRQPQDTDGTDGTDINS
jgi:hypothetical protein